MENLTTLTPAHEHPQSPASIQAMFGKIASRYDLANHLLSLGLDYGWRRKIAREVSLRRPERVLDLATGSGDLALTLKKLCPRTEVIAADFCLPMLAQANRKAVANLVGADGMRLPFANGTFDAVTVAFGLRNMESYLPALREFIRVLKSSGRVYLLDFSMPTGFLHRPYRFYLRSVLPRLAMAITQEKCAYDYLGESIEAFPRGEQMLSLLEEAGGNTANCEKLALGVVTLYRADKRSFETDFNCPPQTGKAGESYERLERPV